MVLYLMSYIMVVWLLTIMIKITITYYVSWVVVTTNIAQFYCKVGDQGYTISRTVKNLQNIFL